MWEQKGMIMGWTKQQQRAIDERGKSLLVSAAAGSGKTAVMVERITRMITEENYSIDEMLIVTFTNAAASEMREKIRRAMKGKARENPGMRRQLDLLPRANISTFHAFAMEVIRRFFYLTDLEPSFRILDEDRSTILREEALEARSCGRKRWTNCWMPAMKRVIRIFSGSWTGTAAKRTMTASEPS